jgi:hypothetical protein
MSNRSGQVAIGHNKDLTWVRADCKQTIEYYKTLNTLS